MTRRLLSAALLSFSIALPIFAASAPSADDFMPIAQGGNEKIEKPSEVKKDSKVVQAATAQDAANAAIEDMGDAPGARMVKFGSGVGFVASGVSTYLETDNPTVTRISKRNAYVVAFTKAKKELAAMLGGLSSESATLVRESLQTADLPKESLANLKNQTDEAIIQATDMMLRGFVIYEVKDNSAAHTVKVVIATSPKTRSQGERISSTTISAASIKAGLDQVIQEVKSGVTPPVGGRMVLVPATGETAMIGFGSTVVRSNANGTVQAKLNLEALQQAQMRASASLCSLLHGDRNTWVGALAESTKEETKQFEEAQAGDPLNNAASVAKLDKERQSFVTRMAQTDIYASASKGVLPPGVTTKTWFTDDKGWAYAVSVYMPSLTKEAQKAADEMNKGAQGESGTAFVKPIETEGNGIHDQKAQRPSNEVKEGPSGVVSDGKDL